MLYLPIKRGWIVSRGAQRLYSCCAIANLYLLAVLVGTRTAMAESGVWSLEDFPGARLLVKSLLWPGIIGTAILAIAMWYFWFTFDESPWGKKAFWFLILFFGFALGPVLFYFFAYRKNPVLAQAT